MQYLNAFPLKSDKNKGLIQLLSFEKRPKHSPPCTDQWDTTGENIVAFSRSCVTQISGSLQRKPQTPPEVVFHLVKHRTLSHPSSSRSGLSPSLLRSQGCHMRSRCPRMSALPMARKGFRAGPWVPGPVIPKCTSIFFTTALRAAETCLAPEIPFYQHLKFHCSREFYF